MPAMLLVALFLALPGALRAQAAFDTAEFAARRERLLALIPDGVALVFAAPEHPYAVRFRQSPDFYYLTGLEEPGAVLLLNGAAKSAAVFALDRPGQGAAGDEGLRHQSDAEARYGVKVLPMESFFTYFNFAAGQAAAKLYVPLGPPDDLMHARFEARMLEAAARDHPLLGQAPAVAEAVERVHRAQPKLALTDVNPLLDRLRWVKRPYEIARLRRSGRIAAAAVAEAIRGTRPGLYEYELAAAAQYVNTRLGARGEAFLPIVPSGPNTPIVHYERNDRRLGAGEIVYMDYGSDYDYYTSDITRVWPVSGRFSPEQEKMYRCVLAARDAIIAAMRPGATIPHLQDVAERVYQRHGYRDAFLKTGRYIGHFVGLSVHDVGDIFGPAAAKPFEPGVVFNVEPLLETADGKTHMRLEDTVLITERGAENLTAAVPAEPDSVYALIRERGLNSTGRDARWGR